MDFINLTPHAINIVDGPTFPPSGEIARCSMITSGSEVVGGVTVATRQIGPLTGLPGPVEGTFFIVSAMAREAAERLGRRDCVSPGELVRNDGGQVIGCRDLQRGF